MRKDERFLKRWEQYARDYDIDSLNTSNDRALLETLIRAEIVLEELQNRMYELVSEGDLVENAQEIKKLSDLTRDMVLQNMKIQETLNIDRRNRRTSEDTPMQYITKMKKMAREFLDRRLIKLYCPTCDILVFRFYPVHDHTAYKVSAQCSQCGQMIEIGREQRDTLFDIPDRHWREERAEIIPAEKTAAFVSQGEEEVFYAGGENNRE